MQFPIDTFHVISQFLLNRDIYSVMLTNSAIGQIAHLYLRPGFRHLWSAVVRNNHNNVSILLKYPDIDPSIHDNKVIHHAITNGHTEIVRLLLTDPRVDPTSNNVVRIARENNYLDIVYLLVQDYRADPIDKSTAILWATMNRHVGLVRLLLSDPLLDLSDNEAIQYASYDGCIETVRILLEDGRLNPAINNNQAIIYATQKGHAEIVKLLLQDTRVDPTDQNNMVVLSTIKLGLTEILKILLQDPRFSYLHRL